MSTNKKTYFASDFHLGARLREPDLARERRVVRWLDAISADAEAIYLVGDLFDFWFTYRSAVPRGHVRLLGKLAELTDGGLPVYCFTGNHDMWLFDYLEQACGIPTYRDPIVRDIHGKTFLIGHGDGLGPGDYGYKFIKRVFRNPVAQWLFAGLHPNIGIGLAHFWSGRSRASNPGEDVFLGPEKEWLIAYCERKLQSTPDIDYFIFGHRHLPIDYPLSNGRARYINLGEWMNYNSYVVFDGEEAQVRFFENPGARACGRGVLRAKG